MSFRNTTPIIDDNTTDKKSQNISKLTFSQLRAFNTFECPKELISNTPQCEFDEAKLSQKLPSGDYSEKMSQPLLQIDLTCDEASIRSNYTSKELYSLESFPDLISNHRSSSCSSKLSSKSKKIGKSLEDPQQIKEACPQKSPEKG